MKILIVSQYFYPENFRINVISKYLKEFGNEITVLTGLPNYPGGKIYDDFNLRSFRFTSNYEGINIHRVPIIPRFNSNSISLICNYFSYILSCLIFSPFLLKSNKYDIIFVYAPSPILQSLVGIYLKWLGYSKTLTTWIQDLWPEALFLTGHISNNLFIKLIGKIVNLIYSKNDFLIISSQDFLEPVSKRYSSKNKIHHIPNPGIYDPFKIYDINFQVIPYDLKKQLNLDKFKIIYTGNIGIAQSIETIINAAVELKYYKNITILIIGDGSMKNNLKSLVAQNELNNVLIFDSLPEDCMDLIYKSASALLVTLNESSILNQTVPAKIQGYLSSKRPIIGSVGGVSAKIIIESNCGLVSPPGDYKKLALNIYQLSKYSKKSLDNFGENGFKYYLDNFDPNLVTKNLLTILKSYL